MINGIQHKNLNLRSISKGIRVKSLDRYVMIGLKFRKLKILW